MKKLAIACLALFVMLCSLGIGQAYEGDWRESIRHRIQKAHYRIERGIENGSLTRREARGLSEELNGILYKIDRMKRDGYLDPRERDIIDRNLYRLERDITREKRDDDYRHRSNHGHY